MQRRDGAVQHVLHHRHVQQVDVEMQDVELVGAAAHLVEQDHMVRDRVLDMRVEPQGHFRDRHQLGRRDGIAAGEEGDVMPLMDQFLGDIGYDTLRPAI